jgi:hypothetical protein
MSATLNLWAGALMMVAVDRRLVKKIVEVEGRVPKKRDGKASN